ncbi:hypothetical protein DICVIV_04061 [Dictyocaulus viviparus]|uniref:BUB1 N-terminal domain-containing protein n=1 Tax=Dictyocaulus viviparus TaxID=29172 RepID=A0A0D8XYU7_DICVI|nr:hypothetical protein DICVIV_04061 [Dictyocaulus viviparus]
MKVADLKNAQLVSWNPQVELLPNILRAQSEMKEKMSFSRFFKSIEETVCASDPELCAEFICKTIILYEKNFGSENKGAMEKILNEAMANFGPVSASQNPVAVSRIQNFECMIPIYSMMRKYSQSSVYEVFEKLYERNSYRQYAMFYVEWSRCYVDLAKKLNPSGASSEPIVKRKHAGVLVAALDFTLEDYDLGDDSCVYSKSPEILKREDNEANIKNNFTGEEIGPSSSSIPPYTAVERLTPSPTLSDNW